MCSLGILVIYSAFYDQALAVYGGLLSPFLMAASVLFAFFAANAEYRPQQMAFGIAAAGSVIPITAGMVGLCLRVRAILIVTYFFTLLNTQVRYFLLLYCHLG